MKSIKTYLACVTLVSAALGISTANAGSHYVNASICNGDANTRTDENGIYNNSTSTTGVIYCAVPMDTAASGTINWRLYVKNDTSMFVWCQGVTKDIDGNSVWVTADMLGPANTTGAVVDPDASFAPADEPGNSYTHHLSCSLPPRTGANSARLHNIRVY